MTYKTELIIFICILLVVAVVGMFIYYSDDKNIAANKISIVNDKMINQEYACDKLVELHNDCISIYSNSDDVLDYCNMKVKKYAINNRCIR